MHRHFGLVQIFADEEVSVLPRDSSKICFAFWSRTGLWDFSGVFNQVVIERLDVDDTSIPQKVTSVRSVGAQF